MSLNGPETPSITEQKGNRGWKDPLQRVHVDREMGPSRRHEGLSRAVSDNHTVVGRVEPDIVECIAE